MVIPLLILLIVNVVNFGSFLYDWIAVANAARAGAQYFVAGGVSVAGTTPPALSAVTTLVTSDLAGLHNQSSIQVCVSTSNDKAASCNQGTPPANPPSTDTPEGSPAVTFVIGAVDVSYTYTPLVPSWMYITLPPTTIVRRAAMRVLQ